MFDLEKIKNRLAEIVESGSNVDDAENLLLQLHALKGFRFGEQLAQVELRAMEEGYRQTIQKYKENHPLIELQRALANIRFSPAPLDDRLEELKQEYETALTLLESDFLGALISGDWTEFDQLINDFRCAKTPTTEAAVDDGFREHQETRSRFHQLITQLKTQGVTVPQLIEGMRNELQLLHLEDDKNAEANTDRLHSSGADFLIQTSN
jgi:hypothetical protein